VAFALQLRKKQGKTAVTVAEDRSQGSRRMPAGMMKILNNKSVPAAPPKRAMLLKFCVSLLKVS